MVNSAFPYYYYTGIDESKYSYLYNSLRDVKNYKYYLKVTESSKSGGGTYWVADQYTLYCDPCASSKVSVLSSYYIAP